MKVCDACQHAHASAIVVCPSCGAEPVYVDGFEAHAPDLAHGGGGYDAAHFADMARLEATNFWFRARNRLIVWALRRYAPQMESMLEVGCGTAFVLSGIAEAYPDAELSGSEIFTDGLEFAAKRMPDAQLMQMDARAIPFVDEFDVVGAFDVIEHVREDDIALREMNKALKPGGILLIAVPQHAWLWGPADVHAHHERRYTKAELARRVTDAGFTVLRSTSFVTLLLPLMMISRWLQRRARHYDPMSEFTINPAINWMLEKVLAFERLGIVAGLNYPVGGSRLLVARKDGNGTA